ncbi:HK97 family phage prohead protease, partial [Yersinia enterocolitica]|nr:HK97 family phage prohead protease [Yersinia enterocolitica]EKN3995840.1 HK97 family phage prohead protease [Yersinia enterocolitica]EKN3995846.1 HK97 family phage prohead protease [Yersinia enterocolitica]EKN5087360.1 HK97 family phage prohead protease [Yersinia enterocolitica]EKP3832551.1 HK97 family phage prohead protease [Yersinia enterocolitica]
TVLAAELREITVTSLPAYRETDVQIAKRSLLAQHPELVDLSLRSHWAYLAGL